MFLKRNYERMSESLQTSEEILFAIEKVTVEIFRLAQIGSDSSVPDQSEFIKNAAYQLWEEGGRLDEILAALPTEDADDGEEIYWANLIAEFDGEKWVSDDVKFGIFNTLLAEFVTVDGESPTPENIRKFDTKIESQKAINNNADLSHNYEVRVI